MPDRVTSESYLVRIYRRDESGIAGVVEIIGEDKTASFRSAGELMAIMEIAPSDCPDSSEKDSQARQK